ncbi:hypothetical protein C1645_838708 [Glomus cerebriforme]|uniref:Uncharacterized protein n=1 Tax=Glomus cerebriforme TaxID=658196 RepID=A0A397S6W7_9GLOM|nr:hypothetical protein C1645_838708 [Glomus cerebriforme]
MPHQVILEETVMKEIEAVEDEKYMENDIIEEWTEREELKEFDEVGKRLIIETLHWHKGANHHIKAVYTGNLRITVWRKEKEKQKLENEIKGMKTLDAFFKSSETLYSSQSFQSQLSPS